MNRIRATFIILFCVMLTPSVKSQNWKPFKQNDNLNCAYFTTDPLYNIYVITFKNEILSYDNTGFFESRYSNKVLGKLSYVDATIPFKVLLYYPDFQTIKLVDRALNSIGSFTLTDMNITQASALAMADDGAIWIFDATKSTFVKITFNETASRELESNIVPFRGLQPLQIVFRNNTLYANVPNKGIYVFDRFGKFLKLLDIKNVEHFQVIDDKLFYKQNYVFYSFTLKASTSNEIKLPQGVSGTQALRMEKGKLFVQRQTSVDIYVEN